jgi:tripartite ATP-independent transporter DctM subunit
MEPWAWLVAMFCFMLFLVFSSVPIAYALAISAFIGLWQLGGLTFAAEVFRQSPYSVLANYGFAVAPMFIVMGQLVYEMGVAAGAFDTVQQWIGKVRGAVLMTTIGAGALFGACSGSSVASAALLSKLAYPEAKRLGFDEGLSTGCICVAGSLAMMIPPSVMMVLYGIFTGESIGRLLIAGVVPGIILSLLLMLNLFVVGRLWSNKLPMIKAELVSWPNRFRSLRNVLPILILFALVIGGIYASFFTPTQAGAIGAFGALIMLLVIKRKNSVKPLWSSFREAAMLTVQIFFLILGGMMFARFVALSGVVGSLITGIGNLGWNRYAVMALIVVVYLILGALLDPVSMLVITIPFVYPIVTFLGWSGIAFGVVIIFLVEMAVITPPVGFNCYVVAGATKVPTSRVFFGTLYLYPAMLLFLILIIAFPQIATFVPSHMMK